LALVAVALVAGGCHDDSWLQYEWDDRRVLCSTNVDDMTQEPMWDAITDAIRYAGEHDSVAVLHAHIPGKTISLDALDRLFDLVDEYSLDYVTFSDFVTDPHPRAGLSLSLDDSAIDVWAAHRDYFAARGARVTFFVTRYYNWTPEQHDLLADLAAAGHDVQAHSVNHLNAPGYVEEHGLAAYIDHEMLPSLHILEDAGFAVNAYAYPGGATTDQIDEALLRHVPFLRLGVGSCPY
jgi:hypothetical protein